MCVVRSRSVGLVTQQNQPTHALPVGARHLTPTRPTQPIACPPCMHAHVQELRPDLAGLLGGHLELVRGGRDGQPRAPARLAGLAGVLLGKHHCGWVLDRGWDGRKWAVRKKEREDESLALPGLLTEILPVRCVFVMGCWIEYWAESSSSCRCWQRQSWRGALGPSKQNAKHKPPTKAPNEFIRPAPAQGERRKRVSASCHLRAEMPLLGVSATEATGARPPQPRRGTKNTHSRAPVDGSARPPGMRRRSVTAAPPSSNPDPECLAQIDAWIRALLRSVGRLLRVSVSAVAGGWMALGAASLSPSPSSIHTPRPLASFFCPPRNRKGPTTTLCHSIHALNQPFRTLE